MMTGATLTRSGQRISVWPPYQAQTTDSMQQQITGPSRPLLILAACLLAGCQVNEAKLLDAPDQNGQLVPGVLPSAETTPVASSDDSADDSVILVSSDRSHAWIAGTDKDFGLRLYALDGAEIESFPVGRLNNVDAVRLDDATLLLAASNRTTIAIQLLIATIEDDAIRIDGVGTIPLTLEEPYGLCMARLDGRISVFVGDKDGRVEEWWLDDTYTGALARTFTFDSQTEGCVVDVHERLLYVGEENTGIWAVDLGDGSRRQVDRVGDGRLTADVEGLDIYDDGARRYLLASSQGDNSFAVYELPGATPLTRFRIRAAAARGIDGASETDGIAVTPLALPGYPKGLLVAQDGHNVSPPENQNFKIVDWRNIEPLLSR